MRTDRSLMASFAASLCDNLRWRSIDTESRPMSDVVQLLPEPEAERDEKIFKDWRTGKRTIVQLARDHGLPQSQITAILDRHLPLLTPRRRCVSYGIFCMISRSYAAPITRLPSPRMIPRLPTLPYGPRTRSRSCGCLWADPRTTILSNYKERPIRRRRRGAWRRMSGCWRGCRSERRSDQIVVCLGGGMVRPSASS
jgi:hypothetical protein